MKYAVLLASLNTGGVCSAQCIPEGCRTRHITQVELPYGGSGNGFNIENPTGGNHWDNWIDSDADQDVLVRNLYVFGGMRDDLAWALPMFAPDLIASTTHSGSYVKEQDAATYAITTRNNSTNQANGSAVMVTDPLPPGLVAEGSSSPGWGCVPGILACTHSDVPTTGATYPHITEKADIAGDASLGVTNTAVVKGEGVINTGNSIEAADLTASKIDEPGLKAAGSGGLPDRMKTVQLDDLTQIFSLAPTSAGQIRIDKTYDRDEELLLLPESASIYGLTITGHVRLNKNNSLVRVILVDRSFNEYLIYEAYPLLVTSDSFEIVNVCEETCVLDAIIPYALRIEANDATIRIDTLSGFKSPVVPENKIAKLQRQIKRLQSDARIRNINSEIKRRKLRWVAEETSITALPFAERRRLLGRETLRYMPGYEYYKGGIFENQREKGAVSSFVMNSAPPFVQSFDWRNRHGANWITPVKNQTGISNSYLGTCWAFCSIAPTEALVNLYFNQHVDVDLAEQEIVSCSNGWYSNYLGGDPSIAQEYIMETGAIDETHFPYSRRGCQLGCYPNCSECFVDARIQCCDPGFIVNCGYRVLPPWERIKIDGHEKWWDFDSAKVPPPDIEVKRNLIEYGPLPVSDGGHCRTLVGFETESDGTTIWILKESLGSDWGGYNGNWDARDGYLYVSGSIGPIHENLFRWSYRLLTPIRSEIVPRTISCTDNDGDGYYNWGISKNIPPSCPDGIPLHKDCDDSNPELALLDPDSYECKSKPVASNAWFDSGTASWFFFTNGTGNFSVIDAGGNNVGHVAITAPGTNVQLYQYNLTLEADKKYRLTFRAYSNTGHEVAVRVLKHGFPYTNYGLDGKVFNITTTWSEYNVEFTTIGFAHTIHDARLMFWMAPYGAAGDQYFFDDIVLSKIEETPNANLLMNPGFESGSDPWGFFTNGAGGFSVINDWDNNNVGQVQIASPEMNIQLYQYNLTLEANTKYRLTFWAYSNSGHDVAVALLKHGPPYTNFGLYQVFNLTTTWQTFVAEFTTSGFTGTVNDGRLMLWMAPYGAAGDRYFFDDVVIAKVPHTKIEEMIRNNLLANPSFESGSDPWVFFTNGAGGFSVMDVGANNVGWVQIVSPGTNVQLYQHNLTLEANTKYRLTFWAYSNSGHDVAVAMLKHEPPYTNFGLYQVFKLTTTWQAFVAEFTTSGFTGTVNDGRLMLWMAPYDAAGDQYFFDSVALKKL
jgi:uncharacterized repeat protein (TIGR01451 family)